MLPRLCIPRNTKLAHKYGIFTNIPPLSFRMYAIYTHVPEFRRSQDFSRQVCLAEGAPSYGSSEHQEAQWSRRGPLSLDLRPQTALKGSSWGMNLNWGPWHFERSQLAAWGRICIRSKLTMSAPHRRVRGPQGVPLSLVGALTPVAPRWPRPCLRACLKKTFILNHTVVKKSREKSLDTSWTTLWLVSHQN